MTTPLRVQVLLATYNGAEFLPAMLDSILAQEGVSVDILVRDDGSTDATPAILDDYARRYPGRLQRLPATERLGPKLSFSALMQAADGRYLAFADQDDVWAQDKLSVMMQRMLALEAGEGVPCLVHCDLLVVDRQLQLMQDSFWRYSALVAERNRFQDLLFQNTVTGCATLINRELAVLAAPVPTAAIMHDHWLALCAAAFGRIGIEHRALVHYRQHGLNSVGARSGSLPALLRRLFEVLGKGSWRLAWAQELKQPKAFRERFDKRLTAPQRQILDDLLALEQASALHRRWLLLRHGMGPGSFMKKLVFWMRA